MQIELSKAEASILRNLVLSEFAICDSADDTEVGHHYKSALSEINEKIVKSQWNEVKMSIGEINNETTESFT